jgi:hypothetical protein
MAGAVGQGNVIGLLRLLTSSMASGDTVRRNGKPPCSTTCHVYVDKSTTAINAQTTPAPWERVIPSCNNNGASDTVTKG